MGIEQAPRQPPASEIIEIIRRVDNNFLGDWEFESKLDSLGLLQGLEEAGIIPIVVQPNPFDPEFEADQCNEWWQSHPEEGERFGRELEKRNEAIRYLQIGAVLGNLLRERLIA